jgi:DNA-binding CsgD family transcriptional regulator
MRDDLVGEIYETVTDRGRLAILATRLQDELNSHSSALVMAEPDRYFLMQNSVSPESADAYNQHLWHGDIWMKEFLVRSSETVLSGHQMCAYTDIPADYRHHVLEAADTYDGLSTRVIDKPGLTASISLYRSRSQDVFQTSDFEKMLFLAPHLKRALSLQQVFGELSHDRTLLEQAINHIPGQTFIVDRHYRIVAENALARDTRRKNPGIDIRHGRIVLRDQSAHKKLEHSLEVAIRSGTPATFLMNTADRITPWLVHVVRLNTGLAESVRTMTGGPAQRHFVIVTFTSPEPLPPEAASVLVSAYQLTQREAETAIFIALGLSPDEIAERMGVKLSTVRSFLKSVLAKMDAKRQSELAARIQSLFARR